MVNLTPRLLYSQGKKKGSTHCMMRLRRIGSWFVFHIARSGVPEQKREQRRTVDFNASVCTILILKNRSYGL